MTTTNPTTTAATAPTAVAAVNKRPLTLTLGAVLLVLAALLSLSSPFLPRGRGFIGAGNRPAGTRTPGQGTGQPGQAGQGTDQGGFGQGNAQGGANPGAGQGGFGQGNGQGGFGTAGRAGAGAGANATLFRFITPIRIAEGIIGGLFTLVAAWGIWKRKKWGMVLALIVSVVMLLTGAVSVFLPLLGRTVTRAVGPLFAVTTFITGGQWEAIVGIILAIGVAVLVLLPASQKGYIVAPKVRRVM
jgi:hypothetical protein